MKIRSTIRPSKTLSVKAAATLGKVTQPDEADPPIGFIAVTGKGDLSEHAKMDAIFGVPFETGTPMEEFMGSRGVKLTRGLWKQIAPAVPSHLRNGVNAAWIVLDGTELIAKHANTTGEDNHLELALDAAALGLKGLALGNKAFGYADNATEIGDVGILLSFGRDVADGKNFALVGAEDLVKDNVPLYKVAKSYLGLLETVLDRKDLVTEAGKWLLNDDLPNYYATLDQASVARIAKNLQAKKETP